MNFKKEIIQGIPRELPSKKRYDKNVNHAPIRESVLSPDEKNLPLEMLLDILIKNFIKN